MHRFKQQGSQVVEFALILPFMILVIFAVIDFTLIGYNKAVITNASREAARNGIVLTAGAWNAGNVEQVACNYIRTMLISVGNTPIPDNCTGYPGLSIEAEADVEPPVFNTPIRVQVSYTVRGFSMGNWIGDGVLGAPLLLTAETVMRHE